MTSNVAVAAYAAERELEHDVKALQRGGFDGFWGMLPEILFGAALAYLPAVGHVVMIGPLASSIVSTLSTTVGRGASALAAALNILGISKTLVYEAAVRVNLFLLIVSADARGIDQARTLLDIDCLERFPSTWPRKQPT